MKKNFIYFIALLLNVCFFSFSSCSNDDDNNPQVDLEEVGMENSQEVMAGTDLHIEAQVLAMNLIRSIDIKINKKDGTNVFNKSYTEGKYVNVKNSEFHEHIDIPLTISGGDYILQFIVTDKNNNIVTKESNLTITDYDGNHPTVEMVNVGENNNKIGDIGGKINIAAKITAGNKIADIEIEFHNTKTGIETSKNLEELGLTDKYKGQISVDFNEDIAIPEECTEGIYHIHFTVKDDNDEEITAENEGVTIKKNNKKLF